MDKKINVSENELSSELRQWLEDTKPPPKVGEKELTAQKAGVVWEIPRSTARKRLERMLEKGDVRREKRSGPTGVSYVYFLIKK